MSSKIVEPPYGLTFTIPPGAALRSLFVEETAMSLGRWRQRARLIEALRRLARGLSVTEVALEVGCAPPSGFIAVFRTKLGTTPRRYFG